MVNEDEVDVVRQKVPAKEPVTSLHFILGAGARLKWDTMLYNVAGASGPYTPLWNSWAKVDILENRLSRAAELNREIDPWLQAVQSVGNLPMITLSLVSSLSVILLSIHSPARRKIILLWRIDYWTSSIRTKAYGRAIWPDPEDKPRGKIKTDFHNEIARKLLTHLNNKALGVYTTHASNAWSDNISTSPWRATSFGCEGTLVLVYIRRPGSNPKDVDDEGNQSAHGRHASTRQDETRSEILRVDVNGVATSVGGETSPSMATPTAIGSVFVHTRGKARKRGGSLKSDTPRWSVWVVR